MITQKEYQTRRHALAERLPSNCMAVIPAASESLRNGDAHFRFRQDSDFYYLTGFNEPDAVLVIISGPKSQSILFNRPKNPSEEQWTGTRLGQEGAVEHLGMSEAFSLANLATRLPELMAGKHAVYYAMGRYPSWEACVLEAWNLVKGQVRRGVAAPEGFLDISTLLGEMRLYKSPAEIALMQQAATISIGAHQRAMRAVKNAQYEYELEAELVYEFIRHGCRSVAYDSIVAGGKNACILHYTENNQQLQSGELVLIDAGGEFNNYAADITRTFPVSGQFSAEQRLIYEVVLRAQQAGIACVRPGLLWNDIQRVVVNSLTEGLVELGILKGQVETLVETQAYKPFYMHNSGHWLGLDVHDCGQYKMDGQWRALEDGMVLTVEPGLYINADIEGVDSRWKGIGVRIEDDIHVTLNGYKNLSGDLMVEMDDIEAFIRG